ncbi:MAG: hypothetical protein ACKVQK_26265, partial [Burkholderiales bacterium]
EEKARLEAEEKARKAAEEKARLEAEAKARKEAEEKARLEAEEKARQEAEARAKAEAEERARREAEEKARKEAEEKARLEAEEKARKAAEEKARLEAEEKARKEAEEKARLEAEEKARQEAEARAKAEAEERARLEAEEKARKEAEEKARLEAEDKARKEAEDKLRREYEERFRREAEEKIRKEAEEKALREAEEIARKEAEEKAKRDQAARAEREAEEKQKREAEEKLRREAEEIAKREAAEKARQEAEEQAKRDAEEKARKEVEEKARHEVEEKAKRESAEKARKEAEEKAKREAEEKARKEVEEKARHEAEEKAKREAAEKAKKEAEEKAKRDAEEKARKEIEEKVKREADEKARREAEEKERKAAEEAEAAALARKEARDKERALADAKLAEQKAAAIQEAPRPAYTYRRKRSLARPIAIGLFVVLLGALVALHLMPLDTKSFEKAAEESLGQPVKIGSIHLSLLPSPQLKMEKITIGEESKVQIASAKASPQLGSIWDAKKIFSRLELEGVTLPQESLGASLWGKRDQKSMQIGRLIVKGLKPAAEGMTLPPLDVDVIFSKEGPFEKITAVNSEKTMTVKLAMVDDKTQIEISGKPFKLPFGGATEFQSFSGTGTLSATELVFSEYDAGVAGGNISGNARLRWGATWSLDGELNAKALDAGKVANLLVSSGRLDGKGGFAMRAPSADKLEASLRIEGNFSVQKGTLGGVDLTRVLQGDSSSGGSTLFSEMTGGVLYEAGRVQARQVRLAAGLLNASGNVNMDSQSNLSGSLQMELKATATQIRANLNVGGTLAAPIFKR